MSKASTTQSSIINHRSSIAAVCIAVFLFLAISAADAAPTVDFDIQPRALRVGEAATAVFTVRGADQPAPPALPPIDGMQVAGPSAESSSSIQFINGQTTVDRATVFRYRLIPLKAGTFAIGPFDYVLEGQPLRVGPIQVQVVDGSAAGQQAAAGQPAGGQGAPALFARLSAAPGTIYNQQIFDLNIAVYSRGVNLGGDINLLNLPSAGLNVGPFQELQATREVVGNDVYDVRRFRSRVIALTAGSFRLEPTLRVNLLIQRRRGRDPFEGVFGSSPFDDVFFGRVEQQPVNVEPDPIEIVIRPLPEEGKPAAFSGAVGRFTFDVSVKPTDLQVGEPITVTMTVTGSGNIEAVTAPALELGDAFKVYESRLVSKNVDAGVAQGRKVFEQVVLPKSKDAASLPAIAFSFFDPGSGRYETASHGPFPLVLHAASNVSAVVVQAPGASESRARILGTDIVYLKPAPHRWRRLGRQPWYGTGFFGAAQALPALAVIAVLLTARRREDLARDVAKARRQRAPKAARSALRKADEALARGQRPAFFEAVWEALASYFGDRLNLPPGDIAPGAVLDVMTRGGLQAEDAARLRDLFALCEQERFGASGGAPSGAFDAAALAEVLKSLNRVLRACERVRL